jgi:diguanylate cyclase (GGDEF)-like protein
MLDLASDGIAILTPPTWHIVYANEPFSHWLNVPCKWLVERTIDDVIHPSCSIALLNQLQQSLSSDEVISTELQLVSSKCLMPARLCRFTAGNEWFVAVVVRSATLPAEMASPSSRRDPLTQLPDRAFLLARLSTLLEGERAADRQFAVLFIDLDNFKHINDRHGHLLGDRVLREVAARLSGCVREGDHVARFGGDEFVVLLERVARIEEAAPVIGRIRNALAMPIVLPEGEFHLSLSMGAAQAAEHHRTPEDLLSDADRQMYAAKQAAV